MKNKKIIWTVIALLVIAAVVGYLLLPQSKNNNSVTRNSTGVKPENTINYSKSPAADNSISSQAKSNPPSTTAQGSNNNELVVTITRATVDNANRDLVVGSVVGGTESGTCTVTLTSSGQAPVRETDNVTLQNNTYTCPNFVIPFNQFPASGQWQISMSVSSGSNQTSATWPSSVTITK